MALRIVWKDFDPRVQRIHLIYGTIGPILNRYEGRDQVTHLYTLYPETVWTIITKGFDPLISIVNKIARGEENFTEDEERILKDLEVIHIPHDAYDVMGEIRRSVKEEWAKVDRTFDEIVEKVTGRPPSGEIFIFPAFTFKDWDGSAYPPDVMVLAAEPRKGKVGIVSVVHEILHLVLEKDERWRKILKRVSERWDIPAQEAFTQTITNLVLWRAGIAEKMFEQYYDTTWEEMKALEDKMREIVREWWLNGGDLRKMIEGRLGR